jgi:cyclic pyranopterin monophosphate synthase
MSPRPAAPGGEKIDGARLTHIDGHGRAHMVDVTAKPLTKRVAVAKCVVATNANALLTLGEHSDGLNVVEAARLAGIQAAKQTAFLIPLCHAIRIDRVAVDVHVGEDRIEISALAEVVERTGVEMEALTACGVAALTLAAALVGHDPEVSIEDLTLWHKSGGRSGDWQRSGTDGRLIRDAGPATTEIPTKLQPTPE